MLLPSVRFRSTFLIHHFKPVSPAKSVAIKSLSTARTTVSLTRMETGEGGIGGEAVSRCHGSGCHKCLSACIVKSDSTNYQQDLLPSQRRKAPSRGTPRRTRQSYRCFHCIPPVHKGETNRNLFLTIYQKWLLI